MQAIENRINTSSCTAAHRPRHNYYAPTTFAVAGKGEHQKLVHILLLKKPPSQEASHDSHQPRKAGSSPIRNIGWRRPPSLFNDGFGANANPPFNRWTDPPPSSSNPHQSSPPHSKSIATAMTRCNTRS